MEKSRHIQAAGGVGCIFINTDEERFTLGGDEGDEDVTIPVVIVNDEDGAKVLASLAAGATHASICYDKWIKVFSTAPAQLLTLPPQSKSEGARS